MQHSEDGGRTWSGNRAQAPHADTHGIWINPKDSDHLIIGNDGGINITYDRGRTWDYANTVPLGQFYEIGVDNAMPYKVCGGLQDNNTWCGPSMSMNTQGITNSDWFTIGGGDGFYAQPDPNDPNIVYAESQDGNLLRRNTAHGRDQGHPSARGRGRKAIPLPVEFADPDLVARFEDDLLRRQFRLQIDQSRRYVDKDQPRPDDRRRPQHTADHGQGARQAYAFAPRRRAELSDDHDDRRVAAQSQRPLGRHRRRQSAGHARRPDLEERGRQGARRAEGHLRQPRRRLAAAEGTAYATFDGHRNGDFKVYVYHDDRFWRDVEVDRNRISAKQRRRQRDSRASAQSRSAVRRHGIRHVRLAQSRRTLDAVQAEPADGAGRRHSRSIRARTI